MLAALAPSAALAAPPVKPADAITGVTWTGIQGSNGECGTKVTISYTVAKGPTRIVAAEIRQAAGYIQATSVAAQRGGGTTDFNFTTTYWDVAPPLTNGAPVWVAAQLYAKGVTVAGPVLTTPSVNFPETGLCPTGPLASYTP
jgi:hypothetical protein